MNRETDVISALWKARAFIREAIHADTDWQREAFEEIDLLLADLDPEHHAIILAEETAEADEPVNLW